MSNDSLFRQEEIEFWENEYLKQITYLLDLDREKMFNGFNTKEEIRKDWEKFLGKETSEFARGCERIFYWLFNQFGKPNSSPIGSDMFFETYNAYIHIDIKTVTLANIGDFTRNIFVGDNQNSYRGKIIVKGCAPREYKGNLPTYYSKSDGTKKICLTYFLTVLYDETNLDIQIISLSCMPNGDLYDIYGDSVLSAGKNPGKIRFNYSNSPHFKLLSGNPPRTKIVYWNDEMKPEVKERMKAMEELHIESVY